MAVGNVSLLSQRSHGTGKVGRRLPLLRDRGRSISPFGSSPLTSVRDKRSTSREATKAKEMTILTRTDRSISPVPLRIRVISASASQEGKQSITQTSYFDRSHGRCRLLGLCDGYGPEGFKVSSRVSIKIPGILFRKVVRMDMESLKKAVKETYCECEEMLRNTEIDLEMSGSSCLTMLFVNNLLLCANIGTSRAVLGRRIRSTWSVFQLTWNHSASQLYNETSQLRRVRQVKLAMEEGKVEGLGKGGKEGMELEMEIVEVGGKDKFVIIGTQELWRVMTSWEAVQLVVKLLPQSQASICDSIVAEAQRRWEQLGGCVADITVIIALFGP